MRVRNPGNTRRITLRAAVLCTVALVVLSGAACTRRSSSGANTDKVDACRAVARVNQLDPPKPNDQDEMERYARDFERSLANVNWKLKIKTKKGEREAVPAEVRLQFDNMLRAVKRFGTAVKAADAGGEEAAAASASKLTAAASELAADETFLGADRSLQKFLAEKCA